jgi:DNA-binding transcriptional LysR family regulator
MTAVPWDARIRRRLKLRELDILMAVVEAGSMGNAARHLNTSQSAVSKAVADLEHALGVRLLDRSRQGVSPTPYGLALIRRGVVVFDELRQSVQDIDFLADPTTGELRIGATEPVGAAIISPVATRLSRQYPRIVFQVVIGDTAALFRDLTARKIEFAISRIYAPLADSLAAEILFHDSLVVAAGARNPWTRRRKIAFSELVDQPWTLSPLDSYAGAWAAEAFRANGLELPKHTLTTTSVNLRHELLATGHFLALLPGFSLRLPRRHASLRALPVELPGVRMPIAIITSKGRSLSPLAQLFIARVRALTKPLATPSRLVIPE